MIRGLGQAAQSLGITLDNKQIENKSTAKKAGSSTFDDVPMMYRAQVGGRCSLMFAGDNKDLEKWKDEWALPSPEQARYQRKEPSLGLDGSLYRIAVNFPFRLISNCGQDSIIRPILGKDGIPFISGSSVKGLFRRACKNSTQIQKYCGDDSKLAPSSLGFRFHGAYPVGDWSGSHEVFIKKRNETVREVRYQMLDVIHPQQQRQVGDPTGRSNATALASISLHKPRMIFEFSSSDMDVDWQEVEKIFWDSITLGLGGKTSTGYGLGGFNASHPSITISSKTNVTIRGRGVSPTLRSDEPEFRPNLFKASLRGHFQRLLAGVVEDHRILDAEVSRLFGSSSSPGDVQILWQLIQPVKYKEFGKTPTFKAEGTLHVNALNNKDVELIEQVLKFAFILGGFGKSWRRVSHELFYKTYNKFEIGCHWELTNEDCSWIEIKSSEDLKVFLDELHQACKNQFGKKGANPQKWREAWHPDRLSVYATVTRDSRVVELFHDEVYKTTPAVGGKNVGDKRPKYMSSVWHRMLPISRENFLEIVTIFHAKREDWSHQVKGDQLDSFIQSLREKGLEFTWGNEHPPAMKAKKIIPNPKRDV